MFVLLSKTSTREVMETLIILTPPSFSIRQTLPQTKTKNMLIRVDGELSEGVTSKDIILHVIGVIGTAGGTGYTIEFGGSAIESLSMEARMSISNMAIEAGARAGIIAPDEITFEYLKGRPMSPSGEDWDNAVAYWKSLRSDEGAVYDTTVVIDAKDIAPTVTWGTSPQDVAPVTGTVPMIAAEGHDASRQVSEFRLFWRLGHIALMSDHAHLSFRRLRSNALWNTSVLKRDRNLRVFLLIRSLLAPVPMAELRTFVVSQRLRWAAK